MSLPVVALIGRPNVGKSTLFNRIIRARDAIVDDMPGVTRDRKFATAEWSGRSFLLVDTGGYLPTDEDAIGKEVFRQVQEAIQEAALVVFMVDARTGLTALDEEIAHLLQRSDRNVLLAINKVDSENYELNSAEFYKLGLGEPVPLSANSGRKVGDFLDLLISKIPESGTDTSKEDKRIALAIVGRPNVGKSSLVNTFLGENKQIVTEVPGTTRDAIDTVFKYYGQEFLLIDTAGLRKRTRVKDAVEYYSTVRSLQSIQRCDIAIVMIDATSGLEMQDKKIMQEAIRLNKGVVIAVNKWDLVEKDSNTARRFELDMRYKLRSVDYLPILFVSALTKQRVFRLIDIAKSIHAERHKTIKTSVLNRFLKDVTAQYAPPSMDRKEVKLNYCTQVKSGPPVFAFFSNAPKSIPANYRQYLENQLRQHFGFLGVPLTLVFRQK